MTETVKIAYDLGDGELGPVKITGRGSLPAKLASGYVQLDDNGERVDTGAPSEDVEEAGQSEPTPTKKRTKPAAETQEQ